MSHRISSIRNLRTIKALRGETVRIDLGKTFLGELQAWMKREPNSPTHREFSIVDNRYLVLSNEQTKDFVTEGGVVIDPIGGKWYFDVEQTVDDITKTIFTGTIFFANDVTGTNSFILGNSSQNNTAEFAIATNNLDVNASAEAENFVTSNSLKQLFWQTIDENGFANGQFWYSYKDSKWIELKEVEENNGGIDFSLVPIFNSESEATNNIGTNQMFLWSQNNIDGVPSTNNSQLGITK